MHRLHVCAHIGSQSVGRRAVEMTSSQIKFIAGTRHTLRPGRERCTGNLKIATSFVQLYNICILCLSILFSFRKMFMDAISILENINIATVEAIFSSNTEYSFHAHLRY